jgi:hypothetical protein
MISQSHLVVLPRGGNIPCHGKTNEESVLLRLIFWPMHKYPCRASHKKKSNNEKASHVGIGKILRHRVKESSPDQSIFILASQWLCWYCTSLSILTNILEVILVSPLAPVLLCVVVHHSLKMPAEKVAHDVYEKDSFLFTHIARTDSTLSSV